MIDCGVGNSGKYNQYFGDNAFTKGDAELLEKSKEATIETPFGEAEIYYFQYANTRFDIDTYYSGLSYSDDTVYESEGKRYLIYEQEVAVIRIDYKYVMIEYWYANSQGLHGKYEGKLENIIPLLLEPKDN